jgi:lysophospholipase L1-like esterase
VLILIVVACVAAPFVLLVVEAMIARRGENLEAPDVNTLSAVHTPPASRGEIRFLWLGDSTAAAVGTSNARFAVSTDVGEAVSGTCNVTVRTRVIAKSGATVADVLRHQVPVARDIGTDVVLISVGANDTIHLTSPQLFLQQYRKVIRELIASGVASDRIVLIGVPDMGSPTRLPRPLRDVTGWRSRRLDERVFALAEEMNTRYVDLFAGTSAPFRKHPTRYFAADKYHPSDSGYGIWARAIAPVAARTCD